MKHVFYLCQNAGDALGLSKILSFFNIIALEDTDAAEDVRNDGDNIIVTKNFVTKEFNDFINTFEFVYYNSWQMMQKIITHVYF